MAKKKLIKTILFILFLTALSTQKAKAIMKPVLTVESRNTKQYCLQKGDIIQQTFQAPKEDFGIIAIQFDNNNRINNDTIKFRIRKANSGLSSKWDYSGKQSAEQFRQGWYFPFGFPIINAEEGEKYIFEIESTNGAKDNCISVYISEENEYKNGELTINNEKQEGDLNFYLATETPAQQAIIKDITRKFNQDKIFFISWGIMIIAVSFLLLGK
jgi:hypothetical protein